MVVDSWGRSLPAGPPRDATLALRPCDLLPLPNVSPRALQPLDDAMVVGRSDIGDEVKVMAELFKVLLCRSSAS